MRALQWMFNRCLTLPESGTGTFFLWGPRQTEKTTLLRQCLPDGRWIKLPRSDEFRRYSTLFTGHALQFQSLGLTAHELRSAFDLERILNQGYPPRISETARPAERLELKPWRMDDGIEILPAGDCEERLWHGRLAASPIRSRPRIDRTPCRLQAVNVRNELVFRGS